MSCVEQWSFWKKKSNLAESERQVCQSANVSGTDVHQHVYSVWHANNFEEGTKWRAHYVLTVSKRSNSDMKWILYMRDHFTKVSGS